MHICITEAMKKRNILPVITEAMKKIYLKLTTVHICITETMKNVYIFPVIKQCANLHYRSHEKYVYFTSN